MQKRLDAGNEFGDEAMGMFGPYVEMSVYRPGTKIPDKKKMVEKTKEHLALKTEILCEAAFVNYNNYCAVDILKRNEDSFDIYEVKNSEELHEQFIRDAAFQYYIVSRNHIRIRKIFIVLHGKEEKFKPVEVTEEVKKLYPWINEHIWSLNSLQKEVKEPAIETGEQCDHPYVCWYYGYCHNKTEKEEKQEEQLSLL